MRIAGHLMLYNNRRGRGINEMGSLYERLLSQGEERGRRKGLREGQLATAKKAASNLLRIGKLTFAEIAESVGLPLSEVQNIAQ